MAGRRGPLGCALAGLLPRPERQRLPDRAFVFPRGTQADPWHRKYPLFRLGRGGRLIPSAGHARSAKSRASAAYRRGRLTAAEYRRVLRRADAILRRCRGDLGAGSTESARLNAALRAAIG